MSSGIHAGLTWGVKRSFVSYVAGLDDGEFEATDGATMTPGHIFHFPLASTADFDSATGLGTVQFRGRIRIGGHFGMMELLIRDPRLLITDRGAQLLAPDPDAGGRLTPLAELTISTARLSTQQPLTDLPTELSPEGIVLFNRQYLPGEEMDPVTISLEAPNEASRTTSDPHVRLNLVVTDRVDEAEDIISLSLADPTGASLPAWSPGSHIDVHLPGGLLRQYSLSSRSSDTEHWRITVLKEEGGAVSRALHSSIEAGSSIEVSMPRNNFPLQESRNYIFVAGGIGITPIVPMIEAADASGANWKLVYSGRARERMAFVRELASHDDRSSFVTTTSQPRFDFVDYFAQPQPDTLVYACGPEALLVALEDATASWPSGSLHTERFVAKEFDDSADVGFEVEFVDSGVTATIPVGRSILEVAEEHDIPVISSCSEGTCGTCETRVLAGIPDHRDSILTDSERDANDTMFICVSRSVGGCALRLDL